MNRYKKMEPWKLLVVLMEQISKRAFAIYFWKKRPLTSLWMTIYARVIIFLVKRVVLKDFHTYNYTVANLFHSVSYRKWGNSTPQKKVFKKLPSVTYVRLFKGEWVPMGTRPIPEFFKFHSQINPETLETRTLLD